jgi:hypothetical protein
MSCGRCAHPMHTNECEACQFDKPPHTPCPFGIEPDVFACQILSQISQDLRQFMMLAGPVIATIRQQMETEAGRSVIKLH